MENSLTFSPFLRFNDGLLEDYLAEKEHLTKEVASAKVRQYVLEIKQTIAERRPYYVDDLGAFYADERGSVQFLFADSEREARRKFDELMAKAAQATAPTAAPEVEVEASAAPQVVLEEKKKPARKKAVEEDEEEAEEEEEDIDVQEVSARGRKKAEVKGLKAREAKDNSAVSKTIVNVTVNTDKDKEEQVRAEEKSKQLEAANSSLQRWMEEVATRKKEQQAQDDKEKEALASQVQATQEELEAQRRRQEEIERALTEKKRRDEEELTRKANAEAARAQEREAALSVAKAAAGSEPQRITPPAVWEEEVVERKRGSSRGALLLLIILALVLAAAALLWFWDDLQQVLGWQEQGLVPDTEEIVVSAQEPAAATFVPAVVLQQPGAHYVLVASFSQQQSREMITLCRILHEAGYTPEAIATGRDKFSVSVGKYRSQNEAKAALGLYAQRYGQKYGQAWILP